MALPRMTPQDGVAWITGASSGIGAAVALELAQRGWTVTATARRLDLLEGLARKSEHLPGRIVAHAGDVTDAAAMAGLVETIEAVHGPIALAFLNAGVATGTRERGRGFDLAAAEATFAVNVLGVLRSLAPVLPAMTRRGRGQIAVTASLVGYRGLPGAAAYGASKAAMIHFCESLRGDCAADGITLQVVNPGFVVTPMTEGNGFSMPFLMPVEAAARRVADGLAGGGFEITFPRRLTWLLKLARILPYPLYFALMRQVARRI
ncbi:SDR family NAD(P)-dependent oxidoreductase [Bosea sp. (in: a-proteobacteria)]|uniref:SDR family NAD(P)-dependent oxidoreductase n=1 Tax=Bosea sp. (in: a-proteobacteria) TaxID=1871050 RepID=UPI003B3AC3EA